MNKKITIPFFTTLKGIRATVKNKFGKKWIVTGIDAVKRQVTIEKRKPR